MLQLGRTLKTSHSVEIKTVTKKTNTVQIRFLCGWLPSLHRGGRGKNAGGRNGNTGTTGLRAEVHQNQETLPHAHCGGGQPGPGDNRRWPGSADSGRNGKCWQLRKTARQFLHYLKTGSPDDPEKPLLGTYQVRIKDTGLPERPSSIQGHGGIIPHSSREQPECPSVGQRLNKRGCGHTRAVGNALLTAAATWRHLDAVVPQSHTNTRKPPRAPLYTRFSVAIAETGSRKVIARAGRVGAEGVLGDDERDRNKKYRNKINKRRGRKTVRKPAWANSWAARVTSITSGSLPAWYLSK